MEQSANEEECGICLDALKNPVSLPCSHKFCSECLNGWRSKYGMIAQNSSLVQQMDRKCPLCRENIPPSKEMICQLKYWRNRKSQLEEKGDIFSENYMFAKSEVEILDREIGDWSETIDYSDEEKKHLVLPNDILKAAKANDIQKVLNWLGPPPVDKEKLNARNPELMEMTLVHCAVISKSSDLLSILLQLGAEVDPVAATGWTPLGICYGPEHFSQARLLLEWGAEISNNARISQDKFIENLFASGNSKLANLLKSEFGGRRCEIINLTSRPDLIGKTCVVEKYLPSKGRFKVIFEISKEVGLVGLENLKRRDRTPDDCGYYISYKKGRTTRTGFASKEECQAFIISLTEGGDKSGNDDNDAEAEARAEEAAASLLAELDLGSSAADSGTRSKKGKKRGKKKKGRK